MGKGWQWSTAKQAHSTARLDRPGDDAAIAKRPLAVAEPMATPVHPALHILTAFTTWACGVIEVYVLTLNYATNDSASKVMF
jgi:hypothetical protein